MSPSTRALPRLFLLIILIHLVAISYALTLPISVCENGIALTNTTSNYQRDLPCETTSPATNPSAPTAIAIPPSSLSFPPAPFLYRIHNTPYIIKYTNYGAPIALDDGIDLLSTAQEEIMYELSRLPDHVDIVIATTRVWAEASARLTVTPTPSMRHSTCGLILAGMLECGDAHGFVEADLLFLNVEDVFGSFGKGSLVLDG